VAGILAVADALLVPDGLLLLVSLLLLVFLVLLAFLLFLSNLLLLGALLLLAYLLLIAFLLLLASLQSWRPYFSWWFYILDCTIRHISRLSDYGYRSVIFFCYQNIEYRIGEFKKLSYYRISDLGLNLSDIGYWISVAHL
jgi:hypothetical protein